MKTSKVSILSKLNKCSVDGCNLPVEGHGLCIGHYKRNKRTGRIDEHIPLGAKPKGIIQRGLLADILAFADKVDKRAPDECWPFKGCRNKDGYGEVRFHGRRQLSHRVSFQVYVGIIADGLKVLHTCDNPPCCNPKHLFQGTQADNIADMVNKGRQKK